ncbi:M1 family metallopeptidase [Nocardioides taihuensis]|uniref:Aminopeptidase N n=1 Tax=Nocardioides taihuensis TaxID=1835606 RepID=A0ABW0BLV6_9ACTN
MSSPQPDRPSRRALHRRLRRPIRGWVPVVATLGLTAALLPAAGPAAATLGDTLFPGQGNAGYEVRHYDVDLTYAPDTNHLDAVTHLRARAFTELASFHLDLEGLTVEAVTVDGTDATWTRQGHELVVTPATAVARGRFDVTVTYSGTPLEHTDPDGSTEGWVRSDTGDGATALGEPVGTMTWVPSDNTPGDKATWTFDITVPDGTEAAANGDLVSHDSDGASTTWTWVQDVPMATYLATVAIGQFDMAETTMTSIRGGEIPIWSFVDPTVGSTADAQALLPKVIRFEERRFGPYPGTSAGMIVDDVDVGYALETQDRPFYPYGLGTGALVHETAHQWYGDSVTLTDWHDIWLAEGFATYAQWLWDSAHGGASPAARFRALYAKPASSSLWHPAPVKFTDPADLFGAPSYQRGAMTLQALRARVGGEDFSRILRRWATEHRDGNVRTHQFEALAEQVSGRRHLDGLFDDWLRLDGKPRGY